MLPISFTVVATFDRALQQNLPSFWEDLVREPRRSSLLVASNTSSRFIPLWSSFLPLVHQSATQYAPQSTRQRSQTLVPVKFSGSTFPEGQCAICFDGFQNSKVVYVPCQPPELAHKDHVFHYNCLNQWVYSETSAGRARTCPLCRTVF